MIILAKILLGVLLTGMCGIALITVAVMLGTIMNQSEDYDEKTEI